MVIQMQRKMEVADYLEWEARQELKHEYIDGEIIEMSGGTLKHSRIKVNIMLALASAIDSSEFEILDSDMCVRVTPTRYVYPDFSIVRGEPRLEDERELTLLNPILVIEVTSPSSLSYDRVDKLGYYLDLPSVEAYLIFDQDRPRADLHTRADEGWYLRVYDQLDDVVPLTSLNCELPLTDVYRGFERGTA